MDAERFGPEGVGGEEAALRGLAEADGTAVAQEGIRHGGGRPALRGGVGSTGAGGEGCREDDGDEAGEGHGQRGRMEDGKIRGR